MEYFTADGCAYIGMDEATISRLRAELGKDTTFVSKEEFRRIPSNGL